MSDPTGSWTATRHGVPKAEMLTRVAALVERLRLCSAYCGKEFCADVAQLEAALSEIEAVQGENVDSFQSTLYKRHNEAMEEQIAPLQGELKGRWGGHDTKRRLREDRARWAAVETLKTEMLADVDPPDPDGPTRKADD